MSQKNNKTMENDGSNKTKVQLIKELDELMRLCAAQKITIDKLNEEITRLEAVEKQPASIPTLELDEVTIARIQLKRLGEKALTRQLNNDEAKLFDIFAKVVQQDERLQQSRKQQPKRIRDISPAKLIEIAGNKMSTDEQ